MSYSEDYNQPLNNEDNFEQEAESALGELMTDAEDAPTMAFAMQLDRIDHAGGTDIGRRRHNEDYFGIQTQMRQEESPQETTTQVRGLYIVCDGMGGHSAGEVASAMAVETLQRYFESHWREDLPDEDIIREGILLANEKIHEVNQDKARSGAGRMGTTLVMALVQDTQVAIAHVGDSRAYQVNRYGDVFQLTVDHEVGQREIAKGMSPEDAYNLANAYQLTQALGPRKNSKVNPDIQYLEIQEDTLLILCSDGLSDGDFLETYAEDHLSSWLQSKTNLESSLLDFINFAREKQGHDNITAIAIRFKLRPGG
ncbi:protein serine/threonine phosphatase [Halothece sp. PCC 7418]|uniref:serine/threonine phosphatase n=1 Tax=Halothece sp. (strain PCC 7418) TaxID=65093 RepID=UPI0002A084AF|nr:serine/threonine phosphatase [Halothece sp. PCC 7418]AFZ43721.1 protein serine/threonine phosphatase [Halothece sp. PCC 7418]